MTPNSNNQGRPRLNWLAGFTLGWLLTVRTFAAEPTSHPTAFRAPPRTIPVHVHLLRDTPGSPLHTTLVAADIEAFWPELNRIWQPAGVTLQLASITSERAAPGALPAYPTKDSPAWVQFRFIPPVRSDGGIEVVFLERFSVNGLHTPTAIFLRTRPELRKVPDGSKSPLARVLAHELGHAFGLAHAQPYTRLMCPGTTGTELAESEINQVR